MPTYQQRGKYIALNIGLLICLVIGVSLCGCANRWSRQDEKKLWISPEASFRYGAVHGFVQTPRGGRPGSTSIQRPTFKELDIKYAAMGDVSLTAGLRNHAIYCGARLVQLSGENVLDHTLISHGMTFPAGSSVKGNVQLNWYQVGYQHRFIYSNGQGTSFGLHPGIGLVLWDFTYKLEGAGSLADRSYIKWAPHIGLDWEWMPRGRFSVSGGVWGTLPIYDMPFILSTELVGNFRLWGKGGSRGLLFVGIGYNRIAYKDKQEVPNYIKTDIGPEFIGGLQVRF
jgi:hypothetical protein